MLGFLRSSPATSRSHAATRRAAAAEKPEGHLKVDTGLAKLGRMTSEQSSPSSSASTSSGQSRARSASRASSDGGTSSATPTGSDRSAPSQWSTPFSDCSIMDTFAPEQWLTDASLTYALSLIASSHVETPSEEGRSKGLPKRVLLLDPASAFWLTLSVDEPKDLQKTRQALHLEERELILCPVSDGHANSNGDSGTHWSLLVCRVSTTRAGRQFRCMHYDSYQPSGSDESYKNNSFQNAEALASRLAGEPVRVEQCDCAQQTNGFDCGMYVLSFVSVILNTYMKTSSTHPSAWADRVKQIAPQTVASLRIRFYNKVRASSLAVFKSAFGGQ